MNLEVVVNKEKDLINVGGRIVEHTVRILSGKYNFPEQIPFLEILPGVLSQPSRIVFKLHCRDICKKNISLRRFNG